MKMKRHPPQRVGNIIPAASSDTNSAIGVISVITWLLLLGLAIWILVCVYQLKDRVAGSAVVRAGDDQTCRSGTACAGICPTGSDLDCPTLAFKNTDPSSLTLICTDERMCQWHITVATNTPWTPSYKEVTGGPDTFHRQYHENDARLREVCFQTLDLSDSQTMAAFDSGCLVASWQSYLWNTASDGPPPTPVTKKRNGITVWRVTCQFHYACAAENAHVPAIYVP